MNRLDQCFESLKRKNRKALVSFTMAGDPDMAVSTKLLTALPGAGVDIIELGMPFSDPVADGPVIQASGERALTSGMTLGATLKMVKSFRASDTETPLVLMGYYNPIYAYGTDRFILKAKESGVDGLIIVDLPPEESEEVYDPASRAGMHLVRLVTPTTDMDRLSTIMEGAGGFLYYVSITGITGTVTPESSQISSHIKMIREKSNIPVVIGFGIKTPEDASKMAQLSDGVVVGSSIISTIADASNDDVVALVKEQIRKLAAAVNDSKPQT